MRTEGQRQRRTEAQTDAGTDGRRHRRTQAQTGSHDEANSRFTQFCERAPKIVIFLGITRSTQTRCDQNDDMTSPSGRQAAAYFRTRQKLFLNETIIIIIIITEAR